LVSETLVEDLLVSEVTLTLGYTGGNGGVFESRSIASTGVMGLTARLAEGLFLEGSGTVVFEMEGTAMDSGNAVFFVELGGQSCGIEASRLRRRSDLSARGRCIAIPGAPQRWWRF
jgi:hypothetical protein